MRIFSHKIKSDTKPRSLRTDFETVYTNDPSANSALEEREPWIHQRLEEADRDNQPAVVVEAHKTIRGRAGKLLGGRACVVVIKEEAVTVTVPVATGIFSEEEPQEVILDPLPKTNKPLAFIGEIAAAHAALILLNRH